MPRQKTVGVLVLGDVGRSPRMQYHALSLASEPSVGRVVLAGYAGSRCVPAVEAHVGTGRVQLLLLREELLPRPRSKLAYLAYAPAKAVLKFVQLLWALLVRSPRLDVLLVQTPPAIPTLAAAWLVRALTGCLVVVDWHNLGFSVLRHGGLGARHPFVLLSYAYEALLGLCLDAHLCVTFAMAEWLRARWRVEALPLHDRPPAFFKRATLEQKHRLLLKLRPALLPVWPAEPAPGSPAVSRDPWADGATPWTAMGQCGQLEAVAGAPALLVSSTSWSADEDFAILLSALVALDTALLAGEAEGRDQAPGAAAASPRVLVLITGKGPLKAHYEGRISQLALARVAVLTLWLEPEDYPTLLGSADLGVCLHASTSGLDLPMKVLDMFGSRLPVCALGFGCLAELVSHGKNGLIFADEAQLAAQLHSLLAPTAEAALRLAELRRGVAAAEETRARWEQNWREVAAPLLLGSPRVPLAHRALRLAVAAALLPLALRAAGLGLAWTEARGWLSFAFDEREVVVPAWLAILFW